MPVDFNLLSSNDLPTKVRPFTPIDAVGNVTAAYSLAGKAVQTQDSIRESQENAQTKDVMERYLRSGGDMVSPAGIDKALMDLKDQLPYSAYQRIADHSIKAKAAAANTEKMATQATEDQLKLVQAQIENFMPAASGLVGLYDQTKDAKGEQAATQLYEEGRGHLMSQLAEQKLPNGQPMYPPSTLQKFQSMSPAELRMEIMRSQFSKTVVEEKFKQSQITKNEATAAALANPQDWKQYTGPDGKSTYFYNQKIGTTLQLQPDGSRAPIPALPPGSVLVGSSLEAKVLDPVGVVDFDKEPPTKEEEFLADKLLLNDRMAQLGMGQRPAKQRLRITMLAAQRAEKRGMDPAAVVQLQNKIKTSAEGIKRLTTQDANIRAGEENIANTLEVLKQETEKLGGETSPVVANVLNKVYSDWVGDPRYTGVRQAYADMIETAAKVYSGQTGAGAVPVTYLELARRTLPENPTLAQIQKMQEIMPKLFEARKLGVQKEIDRLSNIAILPAIKTSAGTGRDPDAQRGADRAASDTDGQVRIIRPEYEKAMDAYKKAPGASALDDVLATRRELKRLGVVVPPPARNEKGWSLFTDPSSGKSAYMNPENRKEYRVID